MPPSMPDTETLQYSHAILLGLLQGVTEFLPISSSGHLALMRQFLDIPQENAISFDILLHCATALVVIRFFWKEIRELFKNDGMVLGHIIVASIPAICVGLGFRHILEGLGMYPLVVACGLGVTSFFLWQAEREYGPAQTLRGMGLKNACIIGAAQALAIVPGISRSGMTVTGGVICGLTREDAFRFSFLMMVPIVLGATMLDAIRHHNDLGTIINGPMFAGALTAMLSGWFSLRLLKKAVVGRKLRGFSIYCFGLAVATLIWHVVA